MSEYHLFLLSFPYSSWEPFGIHSVTWSSFPSCAVRGHVVVLVICLRHRVPACSLLLCLGTSPRAVALEPGISVQYSSVCNDRLLQVILGIFWGQDFSRTQFRSMVPLLELNAACLYCAQWVYTASSQDAQHAAAHRHITKTKTVFQCDSLHSWSPDRVPSRGQDASCAHVSSWEHCHAGCSKLRGCGRMHSSPRWAQSWAQSAWQDTHLLWAMALPVLPCCRVSQSGADVPQNSTWACWCNPQSTVLPNRNELLLWEEHHCHI